MTLAQLKHVIAPIYKRFDTVDQRFDSVERHLKKHDSDLGELKKRARKAEENIEILLTHADGFAKNSEQHEEDIVLLNGHVTDLSRFCEEKFGYHYGDRLK